MLRGWRWKGGGGDGYRKARAEYKLLCNRKRKEDSEEWSKDVMEAKTEGDVWRIVNRKRKRGGGIN